ncbi:DUF4249 domain-containing protein [Flagellimonas algicola]|uniref:DUF4249 domain-containing protein n=1 Tax=Flagellimonas algicola TaxID=2583815 RepID=A0ABY2WQL0_9FLAO|nr:DUF4249 domain-containing protein [Allomuricauda algicola]TMU57010.1 DUF4249 domain-containing protein [Allomuricauda algicola]
MIFKAQIGILRIAFLMLLGVMVYGCIESFEPETETFEDALVIETTITNEVQQQEVILSRAFPLEELVSTPEVNASVTVVDDLDNQYNFQEINPGRYGSVTQFGIVPGRTYQLFVTTNDGRTYESDPVLGLEPTPMNNLTASRITNDGTEGMEISVEYDNSQLSKYLRYKYEETYKIVAPSWSGQTLRLLGGELVPWPIYGSVGRTCYNTDISNDIILNRPQESNSGEVQRFSVRFIDRNNFILSHRYSILVKQLVISQESYRYLETLEESTAEDDLFSPSQPGFFSGNVRSTSNDDEKVLGFFHVATVTSQRIFFNYNDYFPDEELPPYVDACLPFVAPLVTHDGSPDIFDLLGDDVVRYHSTTPTGDIAVVSTVCADCSVMWDTTIPDFWEE